MKRLFNIKSKSDVPSDTEVSSESELDEDIDEDGSAEKRAEIFIKNIVDYFGQKFLEFEKIADVDGVAKEIKIMGQKVPKAGNSSSMPSSILALISFLLKYLYILLTYVMQFFLGKKHRNRAKKVVNIFQNVPDQERRTIFADTGAAIYYSFQYQLNQTTDVDGYWRRGLRKVAKDARDRAMRYLGKQDSKSIGIISPEILTRAVLLGTPKSMSGHTIQLTRSKRVLKTSDLFEIPGLKAINGDSWAMYSSKLTPEGHVGASAWEYRLALDWEKEGRLEQIYKEVEGSGDVIDANNLIERSTLGKIAENVLKEFKDVGFQREEIASGVNKITSEMKCIRQGVSQLIDLAKTREDPLKPQLKNFRFNFTEPVASFSGRETELETLRHLLKENAQHVVITQCAAVTGLGGIGKTELARMYASKFRSIYDGNIIWIDSEMEETREHSFQNLAQKLGIPIEQNSKYKSESIEREVKDIVNDIYEQLSLNKCLIIFDNAEKMADIKEYLPMSKNCQKTRPTTLVTSRYGIWSAGDDGVVNILRLDVFTKEEALSFVKKKLQIPETKKTCDEKISDLTELLSWFPLALRQAAAFLNPEEEVLTDKEVTKKIDDYMKLYKTNAVEILDNSSHLDRYKMTVYNTWRITFKTIRSDKKYGKEAIDWMELIAYYPPDKINKHLTWKIKQRENESGKTVPPEVWKLLQKYSLISKGVRVHRLVQEVVRLWLREENREETVLRGFFKEADGMYGISKVDYWIYAYKYCSLIDQYAFDIDSYFYLVIDHLTSGGYFDAVDHIIGRLEKMEGSLSLINAQMQLQNGCIRENMIQGYGSEDYSELAKNVLLFWAHFRRNLYQPDNSLIKFDNFLTNFAKRFDKRILVETLYIGDPPLHYAACFANLRLIGWLLKNGADRKAVNECGETAIHRAAEFGSLDVLRLLVSDAEECNCTSRNGKTPLHLAVRMKQINAVKLLLEKGADPLIYDKERWNPISYALMLGNAGIVKLFIDSGHLTSSTRFKNGQSPLHVAVPSGNLDLVNTILEMGADVNCRDYKGNQPIDLVFNRHFAYCHDENDIRIQELLIEKGADLNSNSASKYGKVDIKKLWDERD